MIDSGNGCPSPHGDAFGQSWETDWEFGLLQPWALEQREQLLPQLLARRAGHSSCSPKSFSLLHCDVRLSRIDLNILEFCRSVGRSRTKKAFSLGASPPWPPTRGSVPGPRWGLRPQTPVIGSRSPWPQPLLAPPTFKHFQRPWLQPLEIDESSHAVLQCFVV